MAAKRQVKVKEHERLDDATIERVINLLEETTPHITKKAACEILNISYNTTRLGTILSSYKERKERRRKNFAKNRGVPLSDGDRSLIIRLFLNGDGVTDISETTFRSPTVVKRVLEEANVPDKPKGDDKHQPSFLPDACVLTECYTGQTVWSAKHHSAAEVIKQVGNDRNGNPVYQIYVYEKTETRSRGGAYAAARVEELGSLEHLKKFVAIEQLTN
tara:strand:- start:5250 stop:5900 length:651 start_codon:yes stop_codon:yes gene_type:complete